VTWLQKSLILVTGNSNKHWNMSRVFPVFFWLKSLGTILLHSDFLWNGLLSDMNKGQDSGHTQTAICKARLSVYAICPFVYKPWLALFY
jgi:hypothetical protein